MTPSNIIGKDLLTPAEVAALRGVLRQTVYQWIKKYGMPCEVDRFGRMFVRKSVATKFRPRSPGRPRKVTK